MTSAIYARYSTPKQTPETIKTQIERCREYCKREGLDIVATFTDSAKTRRNEQRDGYQDMIQSAINGDFQVIVCYRYDRFGGDYLTNIQRLIELRLHGIEVWSATEGNDEFYRNLSFALSQRESEIIGQRVRDGMKGAVERHGAPLGHPPYGYMKKGRKWVIDPESAPVIRTLFRLLLQGLGQHRVAKALNGYGYTTATGKKWSSWHVGLIQRNPRYTGAMTWNMTQKKRTPTGMRLIKKPESEWVWKEGCHEAYIDKEDWQFLQKRSQNIGGKPVGIATGKYLLTGLIECFYCGKTHIYTAQKNRTNRYVCATTKRQAKRLCPHSQRIETEWIEKVTMRIVAEQILDEATILKHLNALQQQAVDNPNREKKELETALSQAQREVNNLIDAFKKVGHSDALAEAITQQEEKISHIKKAIQHLTPVSLPSPKEVKDIRKDYLEQLRSGSVGQARRVFSALNLRLIARRDSIEFTGCLPFDPDNPFSTTIYK